MSGKFIEEFKIRLNWQMYSYIFQLKNQIKSMNMKISKIHKTATIADKLYKFKLNFRNKDLFEF